MICVAQKTIVEVLDRPHICNKIGLYINTGILSNGNSGGKLTALSALPYPIPVCKGSIFIRGETKVKGREEMEKEKKGEGKDKGKERELGKGGVVESTNP